MTGLENTSSGSAGKPPPTVLVVADEAITVLEADVPVDIAFSDIAMPASMDGFGLAQWIRRERPGIKVILTSGVARSAKAAGELCEHGPMLAKPYEHADLERRIRALLAS